MRSLLDRTNVDSAYYRAVGNRGSSGVDGVTVDDLADKDCSKGVLNKDKVEIKGDEGADKDSRLPSPSSSY